MAKNFSVKVGTNVWIKVLDKYNVRGKVIEIENDIAKIEVPTYYGEKQPMIFYKDVKLLINDYVIETLKELEDLKNFKKGV